MTNPDNIVRVRARNGGRASVYEANGWAQSYSDGLFEGDGVIQNTVADMNVLVGGSSSKPDVVLAENPAGYKIALDLVGQQPIAITAPASNNRISSIVAYTDDLSLATTEDNVTGSPSTCGLIVVNGTASVNPTEPTDAQIRTAITSDGATGSQAAYVIIANILVSSNTTAITDSLIVTNRATLNVTNNIAPSSITANKLDFTTYSLAEQVVGKWLDGSTLYRKTVNFGTLPLASEKTVAHNITNLKRIVKIEGYSYAIAENLTLPLPYVAAPNYAAVSILVGGAYIVGKTTWDATVYTETYITLYYTKNS